MRVRKVHKETFSISNFRSCILFFISLFSSATFFLQFSHHLSLSLPLFLIHILELELAILAHIVRNNNEVS